MPAPYLRPPGTGRRVPLSTTSAAASASSRHHDNGLSRPEVKGRSRAALCTPCGGPSRRATPRSTTPPPSDVPPRPSRSDPHDGRRESAGALPRTWEHALSRVRCRRVTDAGAGRAPIATPADAVSWPSGEISCLLPGSNSASARNPQLPCDWHSALDVVGRAGQDPGSGLAGNECALGRASVATVAPLRCGVAPRV
jgi:hypothetical protein